METDKRGSRFLPMTETMCYILLSLRKPRHGYGIILHVRKITRDRLKLGAGTIYQTLRKLEAANLIIPVREEDRKKLYVITRTGRRLLREETDRIAEIYNNLRIER
ncbi:PadR family transcriptional regulator [Brucepastera parasyntrophica]|uniref:PadR family transcriptional regulator n=1 Tax=Brucepastera parasyntrophica TaxID=2880008 RepID=UPI00210D63A8|nr:helix-turn-helix transcriptional regulator [Brucepastera parasyntrophica]ULQ58775.1 PadR family transcriptional regulator [Brucepastera parasyntrophica]